MDKSAYKFGLFLMASLIMLSTVAAAIPMSNMNLFSDAMASGKNSDKYDNSHEYEKSYYSDDDKGMLESITDSVKDKTKSLKKHID